RELSDKTQEIFLPNKLLSERTNMNEKILSEEEADELFNTGVLRKDLAALGEREVRSMLNRGEYGEPSSESFAAVLAWIADAEFIRFQEESAKRDDREKETLLAAKQANKIAKAAVIVTVVLAIIELFVH
ncbi:MAG: hypothetical protein WC047_08670, partial [Kiritimatiellales bacterium]